MKTVFLTFTLALLCFHADALKRDLTLRLCASRRCPPPPPPSCNRVIVLPPQGPFCPPCRACLDRPQECTKIGCPPKPGPSCQNVVTRYPNGTRCPGCSVCADRPTRSCPRISCVVPLPEDCIRSFTPKDSNGCPTACPVCLLRSNNIDRHRL